MKKNPLFSVIIPVYNHERFIADAINSVLSQTLQDFELIIINDGSTDGSEAVIKSFCDQRIQYISQENHDAPYTINRGIDLAVGKYIAILNSDDVFGKNKLQRVYECLDDGADFVFSHLDIINEDGNAFEGDERSNWIYEKLNNSEEEDNLEKLLLNINYLITTSNFVFKKEIVKRIGKFHEKLHYGHDFHFALRVFSEGYKIKRIKEQLIFYRIHSDNTITKGIKESIFEACYSIASLVLKKEIVLPDSFMLTKIYPAVVLDMVVRGQEYIENILVLKNCLGNNKYIEPIDKILEFERNVDFLIKDREEIIADLNELYSSKFYRLSRTYLEIKTYFVHPSALLKKMKLLAKAKKIVRPFTRLYYWMSAVVRLVCVSNFADSCDKTKIIFQLDSFDKGGLEEVVFNLISRIKKAYDANILVFVVNDQGGYMSKKAANDGFKIVNLKNNRYFLKLLIKKLNPSIVNLHYSVFGSDIYIDQGIPIIYTIHNNYIWADEAFINKRKPLYDKFGKFIAVSSQVRDFFCTRFDIDEERVIVVPNGLDLSNMKNVSVENRHNYGTKEDDFVFINVSSFNWNKFHILMVKAVEVLKKKYPNLRMLFVGNPLDRRTFDYISEEIKKRNLEDNIKIIDYVPKEKVLGLMKMSDCYVMPSIIEGWSIAVMEAMYCELPLILSDIGSARNVIKDSDIGIIINNPYENVQDLDPASFGEKYTNDKNLNNLSDLCYAMENIIQNKEVWRRKAAQGRTKIETKFNVEGMATMYWEEFNKIKKKK